MDDEGAALTWVDESGRARGPALRRARRRRALVEGLLDEAYSPSLNRDEAVDLARTCLDVRGGRDARIVVLDATPWTFGVGETSRTCLDECAAILLRSSVATPVLLGIRRRARRGVLAHATVLMIFWSADGMASLGEVMPRSVPALVRLEVHRVAGVVGVTRDGAHAVADERHHRNNRDGFME